MNKLPIRSSTEWIPRLEPISVREQFRAICDGYTSGNQSPTIFRRDKKDMCEQIPTVGQAAFVRPRLRLTLIGCDKGGGLIEADLEIYRDLGAGDCLTVENHDGHWWVV